MTEEMWAELLAQVEEHGHSAITFYLDNGIEQLELDIQDISFDDGVIAVKLA